ncbi:ubiquitin carboxyl-terminal hydrolase 37-like [Pimephales promelas]|uniref:ubiquitin carboxyl-terminal hydrolase 37-like n=1 Tax=Pimephales promelas TaxID=90988 RepID=UPI001955F34B|nr:ubiquitin carboxyl-terminal hydrolase 37-like [Pimephales promelas]XP_039514209.1 ubiquitin carboxyl-terminal hydrolase 37-like [Pimephales promelas]
MVIDILCDKMHRKTKKEPKKKECGVDMSSSPNVVVSDAVPADHPKSSSFMKRTFKPVRRAFRRILSVFLPCVSSSELDESTNTLTSSIDTHTDATSSLAVSGSSDPELDLLPAIQEKEAIRALPKELSTSSSNSDGYSSSAEWEFSDVENMRGCSSSSSVGYSSSDDSVMIDQLAELQGTEDATGDENVSDVDFDCVLDALATATAQSNGLSQAEILRLIQCNPQQEQIEVEQQRDTEEEEEDVKLPDVSTASPAKIKHLGFPNLGNTCYMNSVLQCLLAASPFRDDVLSQREHWNEGTTMLRTLTDLQLTRLTGNDVKLKVKLLSAVKRAIETHHPEFMGDHQQDAHEFLMVCLSHLKEEGEFLQRIWPQYTCPVRNMEFKLNRLRTCDSCGFQRSFLEDCNHLLLVIGPQRRVTDSLQQYFKTSSFECSCSECVGTTTSEAVQLINFPQVLVLLIMRFDVRSSMCKLKDRLEVPEEFTLSSNTGGSIRLQVQASWSRVPSGQQFILWTLHQSRTGLRRLWLAGVQ